MQKQLSKAKKISHNYRKGYLLNGEEKDQLIYYWDMKFNND